MYWNTASLYQQAQNQLGLMARGRLREQVNATGTLNEVFSGNTQMDLAGRQIGQLLLTTHPNQPEHERLSQSLMALSALSGKSRNKLQLFFVQNAKNHVLAEADSTFRAALSLNPNDPIQKAMGRQLTEKYTAISQLEGVLNGYEQQIRQTQVGLDALSQLGALGINTVG